MNIQLGLGRVKACMGVGSYLFAFEPLIVDYIIGLELIKIDSCYLPMLISLLIGGIVMKKFFGVLWG
jgi:hypothetical protein